MRTDSLRVSPVAQADAREYILQNYGDAFVPKTPKQYRAKKSAQDAHEAIRPTVVSNSPEKLKDKLKADLFKLYAAIFEPKRSSRHYVRRVKDYINAMYMQLFCIRGQFRHPRHIRKHRAPPQVFL